MTNPFLKKNPFMSMWLSGANRAANTARGQLMSQSKRQTSAAVNKATQDVFSFWVDTMSPAVKTRKKKR